MALLEKKIISIICIFLLHMLLGKAAIGMSNDVTSSKATQTFNSIKQRSEAASNGVFVVSIYQGDRWLEIGSLSYGKRFQTKLLPITPFVKDKDFWLKITQTGGGAAHIDALQINGMPPAATPLNVPFQKVAVKDFDVVDAFQKTIAVRFKVPDEFHHDLFLMLSGRIESTSISEIPFHFPAENTYKAITLDSRFYQYTAGSRKGSLKVDGQISNESLEQPFFAEYFPVGSGHPQGTTYAWVKDDGEHLYVAIDFTADNTLDGEKDYAKVYVKTPSGIKEFGVSVPEKRWGIAGFSYTDRVSYQHKTYEFKIPFDEIGLDAESSANPLLELAFAAYGTATPITVGNAYNPDDNEYLAAYNDGSTTVQRIASSGSTTGSAVSVSGGGNGMPTDVVYDRKNKRYFVIWKDYFGDLEARVLKSDGSTYSSIETVESSSLTNDTMARAAFDSVNERYLTVWGNTDYDVVGRLVNADGSLYSGSPFDVTADAHTSDVPEPDIAFDPNNKKFLVVYEGRGHFTTDKYIAAQLLETDGTTDSLFTIAEDPDSHSDERGSPSVAFDLTNKRYLVVWEDDRNSGQYDIYGQIVEADGTLYDHDGDDTPENWDDNVHICSDSSEQRNPQVAFNSGSNQYLVVWTDARDSGDTTPDIYYQKVNADGTLSGSNTKMNYTKNDNDEAPYSLSLAANSYCKNFLFTHSYYDTIAGSYGYGYNTVIGSCSPDDGGATLSWVSGESNGVEPDSGSAGTTFTFHVTYTSPDNKAPETRQLQIDINGDGSYANAVVPILPFGNGRHPPNMPAAVTIFLLSGLVLVIVTTQRRKQKVLCYAGYSLAVVISFMVLQTCASGDGGGDDASNPTTEIYTMTEVDSSDTTYSNGKDYEVSVTLNQAGSYPYKFVFSDGTNSATGSPASEQTLTVN